jgi:hypothetical protein
MLMGTNVEPQASLRSMFLPFHPLLGRRGEPLLM